MRKTLFFQKKIKLLNVQLVFQMVVGQIKDNLTFEDCLFSDINLKTKYALAEEDDTKTKATTSKQLEMFFKFIVVLFSGNAAFLRRTSLEILNSLKLR